jgi:hypothetical protein
MLLISCSSILGGTQSSRSTSNTGAKGQIIQKANSDVAYNTEGSLSVQVTPPNATLSLNQTQIFVAAASNGQAPYTYVWRDESGSIIGDQQSLTYQLSEPAATTVLSVEASDSVGNQAITYVAVYYSYGDSMDSSGSVRAGASYTVIAEGSGEYQAMAFNGSAVYSSTNASYVINSCIAQVAAAKGGTVFVRAGSYYLSSPIVLQSYVSLQGEGFGTHLIFSGSLSQDVILNSVYDVDLGSLQFESSVSNNVGLVLEDVSWIYVGNCQWSYYEYPIYINSQPGNTVEFRDIVILNSANGVVINGANQISFYNPHIAFPTLQSGTAGFLFTNLLNDSIAQPQSIKIYSGWILNADSCFKWLAPVSGPLGLVVEGTGFESFNYLVSILANQDGNAIASFDGCIVFGNGLPQVVLHGEGLTENAGLFSFSDITWIGPVAPSFQFSDQPSYYIGYSQEDVAKIANIASGLIWYTITESGASTIYSGTWVSDNLNVVPTSATGTYRGSQAIIVTVQNWNATDIEWGIYFSNGTQVTSANSQPVTIYWTATANSA